MKKSILRLLNFNLLPEEHFQNRPRFLQEIHVCLCECAGKLIRSLQWISSYQFCEFTLGGP
jgi:hypothetical protein